MRIQFVDSILVQISRWSRFETLTRSGINNVIKLSRACVSGNYNPRSANLFLYPISIDPPSYYRGDCPVVEKNDISKFWIFSPLQVFRKYDGATYCKFLPPTCLHQSKTVTERANITEARLIVSNNRWRRPASKKAKVPGVISPVLSARTKAWELISRRVYAESPRGRSIWRDRIIASPPGPPCSPFPLSLSLSAPTVRRGPKCCRLDGQTNGRAKRLAANRHRGCRPQPSLSPQIVLMTREHG